MNTRELAKLACDALADKKAGDVKVIDIREISVIADYFIIKNCQVFSDWAIIHYFWKHLRLLMSLQAMLNILGQESKHLAQYCK